MSAFREPQQGYSEAERRARTDLAACHRLAYRFGFSEGIDNHLTMLVPGHADRFYLAPFGLMWSEVKASDFLEVDFSGATVAGDGLVEDTALYIHLSVHRLKPHASCVLHTHMPYATALSMLEDPRLHMAGQNAIGFHEDIAYADYRGLALNYAEGERLARALGEKSVLMLRNHGVLVTGHSAAQAFERLYFSSAPARHRCSRSGPAASCTCCPMRWCRPRSPSSKAPSAWAVEERTELHFGALKRLLDRSDADYAS